VERVASIQDVPEEGYSPLRLIGETWIWPCLAMGLLFLACLQGGMSEAASTQILTVLSGVLLVLLLLDPLCRAALVRLPNLRLAGFGLIVLFGLWGVQFAPVMVCMGSPPSWARPDMVSIDPQWGFRGIIGFGSALAFFWIGALLGADRRRARALAVIFGALLVGVFIHSVVDYWQQSLQPRDPAIPDVLRLDGAFQSANTLASLWILGLLGSAGFFLAEMPRRGGRGGSTALGVSLLVVLVCLFGLIGSLSRAGTAIGVLMLGLLALLAWPERRVSIALIFCACVVGIAGFSLLGDRLGLPIRQVDLMTSLTTRLPEWKAAVELTAKRPCLGWGVGSFPLTIEAVREAPTQSLTLVSVTPHNLFLLITAETGGLGLVAWTLLGVGLTASIIGRGERRQNILSMGLILGLVGVLVHNLVDFSLAVPATACVFSSVLGFLVGKASDKPKKQRQPIGG
jgi:O-antigen ligase